MRVCVCVCERERERQRDRETERQRDREREVSMEHACIGTMYRDQRTALWNQFSLSTFTWFLGMKLRCLGQSGQDLYPVGHLFGLNFLI